MLDRSKFDTYYAQPVVSRPIANNSTFYQTYIKRAVDVFLVLLALPMIAPLIAIFAVLIARDGGSPFYYQNRVGKNGKSFKCWKLRSMVLDADARLQDICAKDPLIAAEWAANQKLRNDPRITRIGHFTRKTSIDELPQLWNVLRGDMSLVGPRPVTSSELIKYGDHLPSYLSLRPGITGKWQVGGRNNVSYSARVSMDVAYAEKCSFSTDIGLIFATVAVVLRRTGQ